MRKLSSPASCLLSHFASWATPRSGLRTLACAATALGLFAAAWLLSACAGAPRQPAATGPQGGAQPTAAPAAAQAAEGKPALKPGMIIKLPEGKVVSFDEMIHDLRGMRIVYLGESHDNIAHHDDQLAIIKALEASTPSVAIGMEMFQRPYQQVLDEWSAGKLSAKQFITKADWYERWSMDFSYYEPILDWAQQNGIKVLALNAPDELVHDVAAKGLSGLSKEEQAELPAIDLNRTEHRHFIEHLFEGQGAAHRHHQVSFEHFYEAQRVWDETMAQSVADYLRQPGAAQVVAVITGNGHVEYGLGIPDDVQSRTGCPSRIVSFQEADHVTWGSGPGPPLGMEDYGRPLADYVWLTTAAEEQAHPKLGVLIGKQAEGQKGVKIDEVAKGSPAAKAGLAPGDVILALDGEEVNSLGELRYVLSHRKMGEQVKLDYERGGKRASAELTLSPVPETAFKGGECRR